MAAFDKLATVQKRMKEEKCARPSDVSQEVQLLDLIRVLAASLASERRLHLEGEVTPQSQVGSLHNAMLRTLRHERRPKWTAREIKMALERQGVNAETRTVTNCIDYLVRRKRLQRIARGLYYDPEYGVGIVTSSDLGGEPARYEGD